MVATPNQKAPIFLSHLLNPQTKAETEESKKISTRLKSIISLRKDNINKEEDASLLYQTVYEVKNAQGIFRWGSDQLAEGKPPQHIQYKTRRIEWDATKTKLHG